MQNTKLYIEGQRIINFDKKHHGHEYVVQTHYTFMSQWTSFFIYFQVLYLIVVIAILTISTLNLIFNHIRLNESELYEEYVENQIEKYQGKPTPSKRELFFLTWLFRGVLLFVLPSAALIYRSRLLSMTVFKHIKMHKGKRTGIAYSKSIELLNYLFCRSRLRKLNYVNYITFRNKNKHAYERAGEMAAAIVLILIIFFRVWSAEIDPFILPWSYFCLIMLLLFQKLTLFFLKVSLFLPTLLVALIYQKCKQSEC